MTSTDKIPDDAKLVFTRQEWEASLISLTNEMTAYLRPYPTAVFKNHETFGEGCGTGSFFDLGGMKYILTNRHVATIRASGQELGYVLKDQETLLRVVGDHAEIDHPWDLALLPVYDEAWNGVSHGSKTIQIEQIALAHDPVPTEVLAIAGYAGENTHFHFETLVLDATTYLSREIDPPADDPDLNRRFHFGLEYRPDQAITTSGTRGLPKPPGFSGSTVWNTRFVEAKMRGIPWTPDLAVVTGVIWGWHTSGALLIATRIEHVRDFLLGAVLEGQARRASSIRPPVEADGRSKPTT